MTLPLVLLNRRRIGGFNPRAILAGSTAIAWFDPSDLTTMFQDSAGTTPVTAPAQPVGRILDKSGNGFHATQSTAANRPTYGVVPSRGRVNILNATATLATQTRPVTAEQHTLSFRGTGTITLSGASTAGPLVGTGANDIVSLTFTPTAGNLTLTVSGTVNDAQLELGAARGTYQLVSDAAGFNITDPAGFPSYPLHYLFFGGDLDPRWLQTSTITPSANKVQVFAGVRKLSDAATGSLIELSANPDANTGGLYLANLTNAAWQPQTGRIGARTYTPYFLGIAPRTSVLAVTFDNAATGANQIALRENGQPRTGTAVVDGGASGNFLAYPFFIGRKGGTSNSFNGQLYGLIVRFSTANLDASVISQTERWMAYKTGVTL